jgi:hypothetical protein
MHMHYIEISSVACDDPRFVMARILIRMVQGRKQAPDFPAYFKSILRRGAYLPLIGGDAFLEALSEGPTSYRGSCHSMNIITRRRNLHQVGASRPNRRRSECYQIRYTEAELRILFQYTCKLTELVLPNREEFWSSGVFFNVSELPRQ